MLQQRFSRNIHAAIARVSRKMWAMSPANLITSRLFNDSFAKWFTFSKGYIISALVPILLVVQPVATNGIASAQELLRNNAANVIGNNPADNPGDCHNVGPKCPAEKILDFKVDKSRYVSLVYDLGQSHGCCNDHKTGHLEIVVKDQNGGQIGNKITDDVPFFNYGVIPISSFLEDFDYFFDPEVVKGLRPPVSLRDGHKGPLLTNYKTNEISLGLLQPGEYTATLQVSDAGWTQLFLAVGGGSTPLARLGVTPIQHLVVIFDENISFDHYFGTYPTAENNQNEPKFEARSDTPCVNNLNTPMDPCEQFPQGGMNLKNPNNPNSIQPFRLSPSQVLTNTNNHNYDAEQAAFDAGKMDKFPDYTGSQGNIPPLAKPHDGECDPHDPNNKPDSPWCKKGGLAMGYYDGNTVTALWNYAQRYALNDNSYGTTFGPSTVGALNLISGQTNGVKQQPSQSCPDNTIDDGRGGCTVIGDPQPAYDKRHTNAGVEMTGQNIGDLLNGPGVSWGWFQGGFANSNPNGYVPHHNPFQYYQKTANEAHTPPATLDEIGHDGPANHQYDIDDWLKALDAGNLPAVSFLKPPSSQDAHPGNSTPLMEQKWLVNVINALQQSPSFWNSTAVVIAYDDSDGWYDHQMSPIINASYSTKDRLLGSGRCDWPPDMPSADQLIGPNSDLLPVNGRCGYGPRLPLLVVSPWAKPNFVDHTRTDQTSILRFIEDNWLGGKRIGQGSFDNKASTIENMFDFTESNPQNAEKFLLDETTGRP